MKIFVLIILFISICNAKSEKYEAEAYGVEFTEENINLCETSFKDLYIETSDMPFDKYCVVKKDKGNCPKNLKVESEDAEKCKGRSKDKCPSGFYEQLEGMFCAKNIRKNCDDGFKLSDDKEFCYKCNDGDDLFKPKQKIDISKCLNCVKKVYCKKNN